MLLIQSTWQEYLLPTSDSCTCFLSHSYKIIALQYENRVINATTRGTVTDVLNTDHRATEHYLAFVVRFSMVTFAVAIN